MIGTPWLLGDLINTTTDPCSQGVALTKLQAGDTLYFRAGDYHISGTSDSTYADETWSLIGPTHSGTSSRPITIRNYPGETVNIYNDGGYQPTVGTGPTDPPVDYVRFLGLHINTEDVNACPCFSIYGSTGIELGYCEIIGSSLDNGSNHDAVRLDFATSVWLHHNAIHGSLGTPTPNINSKGIDCYGIVNCIIEDNYIYNNDVGLFNKHSGSITDVNNGVFRRNWLYQNIWYQFVGPVEGSQGTWQFYDNVADGRGIYGAQTVDIGGNTASTSVYNNLIMADPTGSLMYEGIRAGSEVPDTQYLLSAWNNIVITSSAGEIVAFRQDWQPLSVGGSTSPIAYMDFNVYNGTSEDSYGNPCYQFNAQISLVTLTLAQVQASPYFLETHIQTVAGLLNIYVDETSWVLQTSPIKWTTAGRYSDCVGPGISTPSVPAGSGVITVAQIMNAGRYGPAAIGSYT